MSDTITITGATIYAPTASVPGTQIGDAMTITVGETVFSGTYGGASKPSSYNGKTVVLSGFDTHERFELSTGTVLAIKGGTFADIKNEKTGAVGVVDKGANLYVDSVSFCGNTAYEKSGGVFDIKNSSHVYVYGSTFSENGSNRGAAFMLTSGTLDINESYFFGNEAATYGGVISGSTNAGAITITKSWFDNNSNGANMGGAIYVYGLTGTKSVISGSTFTSNQTQSSGGAITLNIGNYEMSVVGSTFHKNKAAAHGGAYYASVAGSTSSISGTLFLENETLGGNSNSIGGAIYFGKKDATSIMSVTGSTFTENKAFYGGAVAVADGTLNINDTDFNSNYVGAEKNSFGGAIYITKGLVDISNTDFNENKAYRGGAVYINGGTLNVRDTNFTNNNVSGISGNTASAGAALYANGGTINISNTIFAGNKTNGSNANGAAIHCAGSSILTIGDGTVFNGNTADNTGGALALFKGSVTITGNVKFLTSTDTVYASKSNAPNVSLTFNKAVVTVNASILSQIAIDVTDTEFIFNNSANINISGNLNFTDQKSKMTFANKIVSFFSDGEDLSDVFITVAGERSNGSVVAKKITAIGQYSMEDKTQFLTIDDNNQLVVSKMTETVLENGTVRGTGTNLVTSGSAKTFIANSTNNTSQLLTTINGGSIEENLIGGAFAKAAELANNTIAEIGNTELNIGGEANIKGQVYAGGYFYGIKDTERAAEAQMTVGSVNINLDGGKVSGNLYAGVHARQNSNVRVNEVNITITGGGHDRVYAGGWAEGKSYSEVGESVINLTGGTVNAIYGGGATGGEDTTTHVGKTTITIGADAYVEKVHMSGRYGYSSTGNVTLNYYSTKGMKRLSGISSSGVDNAESTTVYLYNSLQADCIDYVDTFVIGDGVKIAALDEFLLGSRDSQATEENELSAAGTFTTFDITTGDNTGWEVIAGLNLEQFAHAKFIVNDSEAIAWGDTDMLAIGGYTLTRFDEDNDGKFTVNIAKA